MFLYYIAGRRVKMTHDHSNIAIGMMTSNGISMKLKSIVIGNMERVSKKVMDLGHKVNS